MPPKFDQKPGRKLNGPWMANSTPFSDAPSPSIVVAIVHGRASGSAAAGELARISDSGSPVDA